MRSSYLLLLSLLLASRVFGACGGDVDADGGAGGAGGVGSGGGGSGGNTGGSAAVGPDGSAGDSDAPPDSQDAAPDSQDAPGDEDGADDDGPVLTCAACSVKEYGCTQQGMESFSWAVSTWSAGGCIMKDPVQPTSPHMELRCEPLEVCDIPPTKCTPISIGDGGVLTWIWDWKPSPVKVTCYPKK